VPKKQSGARLCAYRGRKPKDLGKGSFKLQKAERKGIRAQKRASASVHYLEEGRLFEANVRNIAVRDGKTVTTPSPRETYQKKGQW